MKLLELKISISVESYDEKTAENDRNCYVADIVSKLSKKFFPNFDSINSRLVTKYHIPNSYAFREISRHRALGSGWARPVHCF